jgi:cytoskeletal protein CcmA (bactofilin family)
MLKSEAVPGVSKQDAVEAIPLPLTLPPSELAPVLRKRSQEQAVIGRSFTIKGAIIGSEPLHVEGRVEGPIDLHDAYLNVGPQGVVNSAVTAREVVVRGNLNGNITVAERVDIRSGGSVLGDISARSISIEEGAMVKGSIDMRRSEAKAVPATSATPAEPQKALATVQGLELVAEDKPKL